MNSKLIKMIAEGEHQRQDFKYCINDSRKIARSMVAFANTDGGRLLLGIRDNGTVAGVRSDEEYYMAEAAAKLYSKPSVEFQTKQWLIEGKTVLEINIPKGESAPYLAQNEESKWMAYIRKDDQNIIAPGILLKIWKQQKSPRGVFIRFSEDEKKLLLLFEAREYLTLNQFTHLAKIQRRKVEEILVNLIAIGIIKMTITETGTCFSMSDDFDMSSS